MNILVMFVRSFMIPLAPLFRIDAQLGLQHILCHTFYSIAEAYDPVVEAALSGVEIAKMMPAPLPSALDGQHAAEGPWGRLVMMISSRDAVGCGLCLYKQI